MQIHTLKLSPNPTNNVVDSDPIGIRKIASETLPPSSHRISRSLNAEHLLNSVVNLFLVDHRSALGKQVIDNSQEFLAHRSRRIVIDIAKRRGMPFLFSEVANSAHVFP